MAKKKQIFESMPFSDFSAYRRSQRFETVKNYIQIFLMAIMAIFLFVFILLIIIAGITVYILPDTEGVRALSKLFTEITINAKTVALFALGFFFREYLNAKGISEK